MSASPPSSAAPATSLTSRASWLMFAKTISFAIGLALPLILVRRLTQANFGVYKQLFLIVNTASNLLPLSFGMSAFYFLPREKDRSAETVYNIVLFNLVVGTIACGVLWQWPQLLGLIFHQAGLAEYARVIGTLILLWIFSSFLEIAPIANQEVKFATGAIIVVQLSRMTLFLGAALLFGTVRSLVWAGLAQATVQSAFLLGYLRARFGAFWRHFEFAMLRRQLAYAIPLGFAGLIWILQTDLHNYFVANRFGPAVFAVYAVGTVQIPLIGLLQEATNAVLIPHISLLQQGDETREIVYVSARTMRKLAAVYFPVCVFLMIFAREFITFLFTKRYLDSVPVFQVNLLLLPFMTVLQDPLFRAYTDQHAFLVRLRIVVFTVIAALLWVCTARFGMIGAISVVVGMNALERIITAVRFGRIFGVRRGDIVLLKDVGKEAVAALLAGVVAWGVRFMVPTAKPVIVLLICGVCFSLTYASLVLLAGVVTAEEQQMVFDRLKRLRAR